MPALQAIRRKIESAQELQSIVKTMKGLAAASIWQYQEAVESLSDYTRTIEMGLHIVLRDRSVRVFERELPDRKRVGAIVLGSDMGMIGSFNREIASYAVERLDELQVRRENRSILSLGVRLTSRLREQGQPLEAHFTMPGSIAGITPRVQELLVRVEEWRTNRNLDMIILFHHRSMGGASYRPHMVYLLPLNLEWLRTLRHQRWPTYVLPMHTMDWQQLFAALIQEYFFASMFRAFAESLASENASRLASMQAAEKNIEERLEQLTTQYNQERQRSITEELLDIVAGAEVVATDER
jgi:F-type H+-transporting ATPase subunit gamma